MYVFRIKIPYQGTSSLPIVQTHKKFIIHILKAQKYKLGLANKKGGEAWIKLPYP
jgi:hypothetical protein